MARLRLTWRTGVRVAVIGLAGVVAGILALTPDAGIPIRAVGAVAFVWATYWVLDLVGPLRLWRGRPGHYEIPTLVSRHRVIEVGPEVDVAPEAGSRPAIVLTGDGGRRVVRVNPLLSASDLDRWLDEADPRRTVPD